jgi:predicted ATP-dependent endonuclease of OLD family
MRVSKVSLTNIRGYGNIEIELSPRINLIVGENNSGKTTILKALLLPQDLSSLSHIDIRKNQTQGSVQLSFSGNNFDRYFANRNFLNDHRLKYNFLENSRLIYDGTNVEVFNNLFSNAEPQNFIYPFLSKRKVSDFKEAISEIHANSVVGNFLNLFAKVDRIVTDGLPAKEEYIRACNEILGFYISSFPSGGGKKAVYIVDNFQYISLESMGEGIVNILGLILDLCIAEDNLFLIEEPENDIHPKALKKLLNFIIEKSEKHQFVITTHSNIVLKYLGASPSSKIFKVEMGFVDKIPTSSVTEIDNSSESRRGILEDLGYELLDFDIWDTWLILEESSAEIIIRDFLVPNFVPALKDRLKTCSAGGFSRVSARFEALYSLCLFFHLQNSFNDRIWVVVDQGENEAKIIEDLKSKYRTWSADCFRQFKQHDFERYYPQEFQAKVNDILIRPKNCRAEAKKELLNEVKEWYKKNPTLAKEAFRESAHEVIEFLRSIEKTTCT